MCNRYTPSRGDDPLFDRFGRATVNFLPGPIAPIGPYGTGVFIRPAAAAASAGGFERVAGQWGMIRPGAAERRAPPRQARAFLTNNARSETVATKETYRAAWARGQRCLIPAWAFDEPCYETGPKSVWWSFRRADGQPWAIAGLWSEWVDPRTGEVVASYTMLTVNADQHPLMRRMHKPDPDLPASAQDKRSVVPLDPAAWRAWLTGDQETARALLQLPPAEAFEAGPAPAPSLLKAGATASLF